jgi:hypothetical protein
MSSIDPWIRLYSGKKFHFLDPKPDQIDIEDIAHNLSQLCRYTGSCKKFYSIAEHCCHVSDILPNDLRLAGLAHDFAEAYIADLNSPLKSILPQYKEIENRVDSVIFKKFKIKYPFPSEVKNADMTLLVTEMRDLMPKEDFRTIPFKPLDKKIEPWTMQKAKRELIKRFYRYYNV